MIVRTHELFILLHLNFDPFINKIAILDVLSIFLQTIHNFGAKLSTIGALKLNLQARNVLHFKRI